MNSASREGKLRSKEASSSVAVSYEVSADAYFAELLTICRIDGTGVQSDDAMPSIIRRTQDVLVQKHIDRGHIHKRMVCHATTGHASFGPNITGRKVYSFSISDSSIKADAAAGNPLNSQR